MKRQLTSILMLIGFCCAYNNVAANPVNTVTASEFGSDYDFLPDDETETSYHTADDKLKNLSIQAATTTTSNIKIDLDSEYVSGDQAGPNLDWSAACNMSGTVAGNYGLTIADDTVFSVTGTKAKSALLILHSDLDVYGSLVVTGRTFIRGDHFSANMNAYDGSQLGFNGNTELGGYTKFYSGSTTIVSSGSFKLFHSNKINQLPEGHNARFTFYDGANLDLTGVDNKIIITTKFGCVLPLAVLDNDIMAEKIFDLTGGDNTGGMTFYFDDKVTNPDAETVTKATGNVKLGTLNYNIWSFNVNVNLQDADDSLTAEINSITLGNLYKKPNNQDMASTSLSKLTITGFYENLLKITDVSNLTLITDELGTDGLATGYIEIDGCYIRLETDTAWVEGNQFQFANSFLSYAAVPEPSTYAMILGLLALGFTIYRKQRK